MRPQLVLMYKQLWDLHRCWPATARLGRDASSVCGQKQQDSQNLFGKIRVSFDQDKDRENQSKHFVSLSLCEFDSWGVFVIWLFDAEFSNRRRDVFFQNKLVCEVSYLAGSSQELQVFLLFCSLWRSFLFALRKWSHAAQHVHKFFSWLKHQLSCNLEISQCNWNRNGLLLCLTHILWFHPEPEISSEHKMKLKCVFLFPVDFKLLCFMTSSCESQKRHLFSFLLNMTCFRSYEWAKMKKVDSRAAGRGV